MRDRRQPYSQCRRIPVPYRYLLKYSSQEQGAVDDLAFLSQGPRRLLGR